MVSKFPGNNGIGPARYPDVSGASDPLAGLDFVVDFRPWEGGEALRLWQDVAATIPATADFDPIAAVSSKTAGVIATQSDVNKQPLLVFVDGVPTIEPDGVDDYLTFTATLSAPCTIYVVCKYSGAGGNRVVVGFTGGQNLYANLSGTWAAWMQATVSSDVANLTFQVLTLTVRAANDIDLDTDGVPVTKTNGSSFDLSIQSALLAENTAGDSRMIGNVCAVLAQEAPADEAIVKAYLSSLYSSILGT